MRWIYPIWIYLHALMPFWNTYRFTHTCVCLNVYIRMYTCICVRVYTVYLCWLVHTQIHTHASATTALTFSNRSRRLQSETYPFCYSCLLEYNTMNAHQRRIVNPLDAFRTYRWWYTRTDVGTYTRTSHGAQLILGGVPVADQLDFHYYLFGMHTYIIWVRAWRNSIRRESHKLTSPPPPLDVYICIMYIYLYVYMLYNIWDKPISCPLLFPSPHTVDFALSEKYEGKKPKRFPSSTCTGFSFKTYKCEIILCVPIHAHSRRRDIIYMLYNTSLYDNISILLHARSLCLRKWRFHVYRAPIPQCVWNHNKLGTMVLSDLIIYTWYEGIIILLHIYKCLFFVLW